MGTGRTEDNMWKKIRYSAPVRGFMKRFKAVLIVIDNLVAAVLWGYPNLTISAQMYRWELAGKRSWPRKLIDLLFWWDPDHCHWSYWNEVNNLRIPRDMRKIIDCSECASLAESD